MKAGSTTPRSSTSTGFVISPASRALLKPVAPASAGTISASQSAPNITPSSTDTAPAGLMGASASNHPRTSPALSAHTCATSA